MNQVPEPPVSSFDPYGIVQAQKKRRTQLLLGVAGVGIVVGAGIFAISYFANKSAVRERNEAFSRLTTCLIGDPLAASEHISTRFRNLQHATAAIPESKRALTGEGPWPVRCGTYAFAVAERTKSMSGAEAFAENATKLGEALSDLKSTTADLAPTLEKVWGEAPKFGLVATQVSTVTLPPPAPHPLSVDDLPNSARILGASFLLENIHVSPFFDEPLRFVIDEKNVKGAPALCTVEAGPKIRCTAIPAPAADRSPALRLWGTVAANAPVYVFAGDRGNSGIFRADDGSPWGDQNGLTYGASSMPSGLSVLRYHEKAPVGVDLVLPTGKRLPLLDREGSGNPYYNTGLFWDAAVFRAVRKDHTIGLFVRSVLPDGLGPVSDLGDITERAYVEAKDDYHISGCRLGDSIVLRVKGSHSEFLSFRNNGQWSSPVESSGLARMLTCAGTEATLIGVNNPYHAGNAGFFPNVFANRCTVSGCTSARVDMKTALAENKMVAPANSKDFAAVELNGKLALVWSTAELGSVRTRVAPAEQIEKMEDHVIFDTKVKDGIARTEPSLYGFRVLSTGRNAIILLATTRGVFALSLGEDGEPKPVLVESPQ